GPSGTEGIVGTFCRSPPMRMKGLGAKVSSASASPPAKGRLRLSRKPPPAAAPASRNLRRERPFADGEGSGQAAWEARYSRIMSACLSVRLRGLLDRFTNAKISPAAADVAGHCVVDIGILRMRVARQERRS